MLIDEYKYLLLEVEEMDKVDSENIDKIGIFLSLSCCIHCLATPIILMMAPSLGEYFESVFVHVGLFILVAPIALFSFISTYKKNGHRKPLVIGLVGLFGLFIGMFIHSFLEHGHTHENEILHDIEMVVNVVAGLIMIYAHLINFKERECKTC
jgi:uncharacterized membrane protein